MTTETAPAGGAPAVGDPRRPRPAWRIVAEGTAFGPTTSAVGRPFEDIGGQPGPRFAVYRGHRRMAWGLRSRGAAVRWIVRLGGRPPLETAAGPGRGGAAWWSEHD